MPARRIPDEHSAQASSKAAGAAESSATAAESITVLEHRRERDLWVERIAGTLPDTTVTPRVIDSLPAHLAPD